MDNFSQYLQNIQTSQGIQQYSNQLQQTALEKIQESNAPFQDIGSALIGESIREVGGALLKNVVSKAGDAIMNTSKGLLRNAMEKAGIDSDTIEQTLQGNLGQAMKSKVSDLLDQAKGKAQGLVEDVQNQAEGLLDNVQGQASNLMDDLQGQASSLLESAQSQAQGLLSNVKSQAQDLLDNASDTVQNTIDTATNQAQSYVSDLQNTASNTIDDLTQRASNISDILQSQPPPPQQSELQQTQDTQTNQNLSDNQPEFEDSTGDLLEPSNASISSEFIPKQPAVAGDIGADVGAEAGADVGAEIAGAEVGAIAVPGVGEVLGPLIALGAGLAFLFGHSDDSTPPPLPFINPTEQFL